MLINTQNHRNSQNHDARPRTLTWILVQREFRSLDPNLISTVWTNSQNLSEEELNVMESGRGGG